MGFCSSFFVSKFHIDVTDHMISKIIAYVKVFDFSILGEFLKDVFVKVLEEFLYFFRVYRDRKAVGSKRSV